MKFKDYLTEIYKPKSTIQDLPDDVKGKKHGPWKRRGGALSANYKLKGTIYKKNGKFWIVTEK